MTTIDQLVDRYADSAALVRPMAIEGVSPDPDDDAVIGTALAARADLIITGVEPSAATQAPYRTIKG